MFQDFELSVPECSRISACTVACRSHGFGGLVEVCVWVAVDILGFRVLGEIVYYQSCGMVCMQYA